MRGYLGWDALRQGTDPRFTGALDAFSRDLAMAKDTLDAQLVHCHTWYTDLAGYLAKLLWGVPLVLTIHSLEPPRRGKREQLGAGYHLSSWMERASLEQADAVVAVAETRNDVLAHFSIAPERVHVIHNGIDLDEYRRTPSTDALVKARDRSNAALRALRRAHHAPEGHHPPRQRHPAADPALQIVLCAGAPDTPEIGREMEMRVAELSATRGGVIWLREMLPRAETIELYSHAAVFCCPSVYEPFGIINLEAMACETAVVASAVGGIKEVVVDGETGFGLLQWRRVRSSR